jgi:hypothetical protein
MQKTALDGGKQIDIPCRERSQIKPTVMEIRPSRRMRSNKRFHSVIVEVANAGQRNRQRLWIEDEKGG